MKAGIASKLANGLRMLAILVLLFGQFGFLGATNASAGSGDDDALVYRKKRTTRQVDAPLTPLQESLKQAIKLREKQGLPVPTISFDYDITTAMNRSSVQSAVGAPVVYDVTINSLTKIHFDNPQQAGYEKWPDFIVEGDVPKGAYGTIKPGNYNQLVYDKMAEQVPGFWDMYEFGYEPRDYTFVETISNTYGEQQAELLEQLTCKTVDDTVVDEILLGFTITGPNLDYSVSYSIEDPIFGFDIVDFWAGFKFDYGLGLRLPMEASLTTPQIMPEGASFDPITSIAGVNWDADDYTRAGIAPEEGNEFLMRFIFKVGVFLEVTEIDVIDLGIDVEKEEYSDFKTPLGPGEYFSLPNVDIPLWDKDFGLASLEIGFSMVPSLGSDKVTANWQTTGDYTANGQLMYASPNTPISFGPIYTIDGPSRTEVQLDEFRYYFTQFKLDLSAYIAVDVFSIWDERYSVPITDFDLGALTGDLYMGVHSGTDGTVSNTVLIGILDTFDRPDWNLGRNWRGYKHAYRIVDNQVDVRRDGPIYWKDVFGANQEVNVVIDAVDPAGLEQDLLLKVQGEYGPNWGEGAIEVLYDAKAGTATVWTFRLDTLKWYEYHPSVAVTFANGDVFGAHALATGEVVILKNNQEVGRVTLNAADQAFFNLRGGHIGLWFIDAEQAFFDDFGGGNIYMP